MYISVYDENLNHLSNVTDTTHELTVRVYDNDTFSAEGICDEDINNAKIAVLNDDNGKYIYACFTDGITSAKSKRTIKGLDFKTLWDTEILLDYTKENSFDARLSSIFAKVKEAVFETSDMSVCKIPVKVNIPIDETDTSEVYGTLAGTYKITNAYKFLKCYLKYYEYNIETSFDETAGEIIFDFVKCKESLSVDLNDFIYELTTTSSATNKSVATIKYNVETPQKDKDGKVIYTDIPKKDSDGNPVKDKDGNIEYIPKYAPRPENIAAKYYYRDRENNIVESDEYGDIEKRLYPVKAKLFESEYLSDAQYNAVYELANSRYVDNIIIDNNIVSDPVDFAIYPLYTKVSLYYGGRLYKTLPISEKITKTGKDGTNTQIKLGFKKILLTEIIKG